MEKKIDYAEMMNSRPLVKVDKTMQLKHGQLFGFQTFEEGKINAAYPTWGHNGEEVQFVLYVSASGKPCIDNEWIREDRNRMYTNVDPIIVDIPVKQMPSTFQQEISSYFTQ